MANKVPTNWRVCATCSCWCGRASSDCFHSWVDYDGDERAMCAGGGFSGCLMQGMNSCSQWEQRFKKWWRGWMQSMFTVSAPGLHPAFLMEPSTGGLYLMYADMASCEDGAIRFLLNLAWGIARLFGRRSGLGWRSISCPGRTAFNRMSWTRRSVPGPMDQPTIGKRERLCDVFYPRWIDWTWMDIPQSGYLPWCGIRHHDRSGGRPPPEKGYAQAGMEASLRQSWIPGGWCR